MQKKIIIYLMVLLFVGGVSYYPIRIIRHLWRIGHSERDDLYRPIASGDFKNISNNRLSFEILPRFTGPHIIVLKFGKKTLRDNTVKEPFLYFDGVFNLAIYFEGRQLVKSRVSKIGRSLLWKDAVTHKTDFDFIGETTLCEMDLKAGKKYSLEFEVQKKDSRIDDSGAKLEVKYSYYE